MVRQRGDVDADGRGGHGSTLSAGGCGGVFAFYTINRNPDARLAITTIDEDLLRLLPRRMYDPSMFIKPDALRRRLANAGLVQGLFTGLCPRGLNRCSDLTFGRLPLNTILYMGTARKPATL
jgi:2-polyprenyl-6-hydroxyphenyl methylase/3-demethylubiquinone-9 3-methyltransferase